MDDRKDPLSPAENIPIRITDRRPRFDSEKGSSETAAPTPPRPPSMVAELEKRAGAAEGKLAEALELLRRREAEADDFRTRLRKEMERRTRAELEARLRDLLEVVDSLDRGIAAAAGEAGAAPLREGLAKVREQFLSILARQGIQPMNLAGSRFDPQQAEAVALTPAEAPESDNLVLEEIRRGYLFDGQVLRPAQVRVARSAASRIIEPRTGGSSPSES